MVQRIISSVIDCLKQVPGERKIKGEPYLKADMCGKYDKTQIYYDLYYFGQTYFPAVYDKPISFVLKAIYQPDLEAYRISVIPLYVPDVEPLDLDLPVGELMKTVTDSGKYRLRERYLDFSDNKLAQFLHYLSIDLSPDLIEQEPISNKADGTLSENELHYIEHSKTLFRIRPTSEDDNKLLFKYLTKARAVLLKQKPDHYIIMYHLDTAAMKHDLKVDDQIDTDYAYYAKRGSDLIQAAIKLVIDVNGHCQLTVVNSHSQVIKTMGFRLKGNVFSLLEQLQNQDHF